MLRLHLGVYDIPYDYKSKKGKSPGKSTGDVAEILEAKYHIMEIFFEVHKEDVAKYLEKSLVGVLEGIMMGAPVTLDPFGKAMSDLKLRFSKFLTQNEMDRLGYPGVPTAASGRTGKRKGGINHRLKHPYAKGNPARPSFVDTSEYVDSFVAWVDRT